MTRGDAGPLRPRQLTWAALLGRWVEFAQSALALPQDAVGDAVRESVPDVIMLQAVWFALKDLDSVAPDQRALGLDRAGLLIEKHAAALERRWAGDLADAGPVAKRGAMPPQLRELVDDAGAQLSAARRRWATDPGRSDGQNAPGARQ